MVVPQSLPTQDILQTTRDVSMAYTHLLQFFRSSFGWLPMFRLIKASSTQAKPSTFPLVPTTYMLAPSEGSNLGSKQTGLYE